VVLALVKASASAGGPLSQHHCQAAPVEQSCDSRVPTFAHAKKASGNAVKLCGSTMRVLQILILILMDAQEDWAAAIPTGLIAVSCLSAIGRHVHKLYLQR